jgi:hypothetical protein
VACLLSPRPEHPFYGFVLTQAPVAIERPGDVAPTYLSVPFLPQRRAVQGPSALPGLELATCKFAHGGEQIGGSVRPRIQGIWVSQMPTPSDL